MSHQARHHLVTTALENPGRAEVTMMTDQTDRIEVITASRIMPQPDGTRADNSWTIAMRVDGVVHEVGFNRRTNEPRLPNALLGHELAPEIRRAASDEVLNHLLTMIAHAKGEGQTSP